MPAFTMEKIVEWVLVIVAFIIIVIALTGLKVGSSFYYQGCEGDIGGKSHAVEGKFVYDNPRCTVFKTSDKCEITSYVNISQETQNVSVCLWLDNSCYMNGELSCKDFTQLTSIKCQDVPDCKPISAIKAAVTRLKPGD